MSELEKSLQAMGILHIIYEVLQEEHPTPLRLVERIQQEFNLDCIPYRDCQGASLDLANPRDLSSLARRAIEAGGSDYLTGADADEVV